MKIFKQCISIFIPTLIFSYSASTLGLTWGESNWGEADWGVDKISGPGPKPEAPIPSASKVRSITGSETNAAFSGGAYAANGSPTYSNSFLKGDLITLVGEVYPDSSDVGKSGEIVVVMLSVIAGKQVWSFLNNDGNFESWNLKLQNLGSAVVLETLDNFHAVNIFEGNLQPGLHRLAIGYMTSSGPLIYTAKAIKLNVTE